MSDYIACDVCKKEDVPGKLYKQVYAKALREGESKSGKEIYKNVINDGHGTLTYYYYNIQEISANICKSCMKKEMEALGIKPWHILKRTGLGEAMARKLKGHEVANKEHYFYPHELKKLSKTEIEYL